MPQTLNRLRWYCSERSGACLSYCLILLAGASTHADRTYNLSVVLERYSPSENHDTSGIGGVDSKELATGLGVLRQVLGCDVERARRVRFVDRNIYAADPGTVHPHVCDEVCAFVHNSNVHGLSDFRGLFLRGRNYPSSVVEGDHRVYFEAFCTSAIWGSQAAETELNQVHGGGTPEVAFSEIPREAGLNGDARKMVPVKSGGGGVCWIKAQWIKSSPGDCVRRS